MRKSNFKILALTAALIMPLSSCKETIIYVTPEDTPNDDIKTPIELSVGGVDGAVESSSTRAVITDGTSKTLQPFDVNTKIFMVMKSEYGTTDFNDPDNPHVAKYTVARGDVYANSNSVVFDPTNQRYWDDAHARSSQLDIWAYAQKGQSWTDCTFEVPNANGTGLDAYKDQPYHTANTPSPVWTKGTTGEIYPAIRTWRASHYITSTASNYRCQDATTVMCQDLLFSNNLTNNQTYNGTGGDKRLKFDFTARKFPQAGQAHMIFYHAMSKITIHIKKGDGFTNSDPFAFNTGNIKLIGFNTEGLFNLKTGQFEYIWKYYDIPSIYKWGTAASGDAYTLEALVIPNVDGNATGLIDTNSKLGKESDEVSMEFTIDNSNYKLKQKDLFKAIKDKTENNILNTATEIKLEAGKNYIFTFVVGKTKIEHLTATVADWEDVVANEYTPIIDVNQDYGEKGSGENDFDKTYTLLRSTTKAGSYGNGSCSDGNSAKMEYNTTDNKYNAMAPQLYWPDHKTHYFFRGVYPEVKTSVTEGYPTIDTEGKTISVTNCAYVAGKSPSDLMIGIPRNSDGTDETCKVDGTGHKASSAQGICATSGNINLNFRYVMSQVEVRLKTTTDDAAVNLTNAKVEIVNCYNSGTIALSDGGATVSSDSKGDYELKTVTTGDTRDGVSIANIRHDAIVPQNLTYTTDGTNTNLRFKITIYKTGSTTEIDDIYYADIKDIKVKVGTADPATITSWEAGKHYIYTLNLKKTEIKVSATITDWVTATGSTNVWF